MLSPQVVENCAFPMPWQLHERLYKALAASDTSTIANVGFCAIAFETRTEFNEKALGYTEVWMDASKMLSKMRVTGI